MFVPDRYRAPRPDWVMELVRAHPLALLVTSGADGLHATHVPVVVDEEAGELVLLGHLNRRNPHCGALPGAGESLLVFSGPNSYVSPSWYATTHPAAPTWNFASVHVCGTLRLLDEDATRRVVRVTAQTFEARFGAGWDAHASFTYFDQLLPEVAGFALDVREVRDMFKLSQEKPADVRSVVAAALAAKRGGGPDVAELMLRLDRGTT
ncbi:FMN-binding negative transcriptional regulator [Actinosynnema pretiosum subsp. pretiosum]|uniref:FMN-binding negative transcriptional regulator n=1 Tax=Actinosynnema pretiosum subsp. pretiosum TaxID=103721 RepID=A0AA45L5V5_9PSEU|nr:Transcriptional regulator [Actinosynnema pretiosum subsp. pretiosum]QUF04079.1 FMN-binding negative transcriptional regulator [Actinosynnema pretiosum subsp. pretiosum]